MDQLLTGAPNMGQLLVDALNGSRLVAGVTLIARFGGILPDKALQTEHHQDSYLTITPAQRAVFPASWRPARSASYGKPKPDLPDRTLLPAQQSKSYLA